ncbi:MAG: enoyl-CoA hydratase/isomerase family protein [Gammaproteobacteria bacterium]|nr:MAG: enoyl-CoA hydratase/isomerase family protein [Gammaproteobacteria bacterium]
MNEAAVLFEERASGAGKRIGIATLNSEKTLNALTFDMVQLLLDKLRQWQSDDTIACVFIQGAGPKALCAGGDVQQLYRSAIEQPGGPCEDAEAFFELEYRMNYLLHTYAKPIICWGHGIVMGGGLGILAGCSHRIVTEKTRMAMPEVTIALFPDVGGSWFLNRMPGRVGLFLALTAAAMNGPDCIYTGIADRFIASTLQQEVLSELGELQWNTDSEMHGQQITHLLRKFEQRSAEQKPAGNVAAHYDVIQDLTDQDSFYDIVDAITSVETEDTWLQRASSGLAQGSPISASNIYQALQETLHMSLAEVFQFELMLATNVVRHPEFAEGVRALLIDKDKNPRWQYASVRDVPRQLMASMITLPWPENPLANITAQ